MLALAALALAALTGVASAGPGARDGDPAHVGELAAYREAVDAGTVAFREARFAEARAAFERALAIHDDPVLLFNIASCWRREGQSVQAVAAYLRFLDLAPVGDPRRTLATETVATLEAELAAVAAMEADAAPPPVPAPVDDPEPRIEVAAADEPFATPLPAAPPPPPRPRSALRPLGIGLTTVGAIALIAGGVEALRARNLEDDVEGFHGHAWNRDEANTYQKGESTARRAMVFSIAGAVVVTGGVTLFFVGRSRERAVRISAAPTSGGGAVVLGGRF